MIPAELRSLTFKYIRYLMAEVFTLSVGPTAGLATALLYSAHVCTIPVHGWHRYLLACTGWTPHTACPPPHSPHRQELCLQSPLPGALMPCISQAQMVRCVQGLSLGISSALSHHCTSTPTPNAPLLLLADIPTLASTRPPTAHGLLSSPAYGHC